MSKAFNLLYYPLALAAEELKCPEVKLLLLAQAGGITLHQYPDPTGGLIEWEPISTVDIGAILIRGTKTGQRYRDTLSAIDIQLTDIVLLPEEMVKAFNLLAFSENERKEEQNVSTKTINYLARFAKSIVRIHYGADVADNLRNALENADSEICEDFKNAGLMIPKGRALGDHLRKVDVETSDN
ncbi:TPA: hypothetical protein U2R10_003830 [Proteus mirabilis]|nr:hypothetical protein [Proteus mirabilis]